MQRHYAMIKSIENVASILKTVLHIGTIFPYFCTVSDTMDGYCKKYAVLRVKFTHWHGSCYNNGHMSTVR